MCVVSMIADDWQQRRIWPPGAGIAIPPAPEVPRWEFDALKREIEELKKLLLAAKKYDEATGQKDCEKEEKIAFLKRLAEMVGVDLSEVFPGVKP